MNRGTKLTGVLVLLGGAALVAGQAQQPAPQRPMFRTQIEYVEVDVVATDRDGRFVQDLRKEDFVIKEDGKPQSITAFTMVNVPVERVATPLFASQPIAPDARTNEKPFEGRVYVLMLDDLHVDAMRSQKAKNAARDFIDRNLAPNDLMAVVTVGGIRAATQEFTNDKALLKGAVDNFMGSKLPSASIARNEAYFRQLTVENRTSLLPNITIPDPYEQTRLFNARASLRTIRDVSDWFGGVRGRRKSVLLVSEGLDIEMHQIVNIDSLANASLTTDNHSGAQITVDLLEAIGSAQRANVSLYTIDPRGLTGMGDDSIAVTAFASQNEVQVVSGSQSNALARAIGPSSIRDELLRSQDDLRTLSDATGGMAAVNMNDFDVAFDKIVRDNSFYYVLAYNSPNEKRDGKFHSIDVQIKRPGVVVRSRKGYNAPTGVLPIPVPGAQAMSPELRETLSSPLPVSGVTMHVFAAPFRGPGGKASVLLGVDAVGGTLNLSEKNSLELAYMALDTTREMRAGSNDRLSLNLKADTKARAQQTGVRILNRLDLEAGRYQIRVASHDSMGGGVGSVTWDVEVPDFGDGAMTMSGIVMTSVTTSSWLTGKSDEQMRKVLPAQPTAIRAFPQDDEIALFAEVYDNRASTPHQVDIVAAVISNEGRVLFKSQEQRSSMEIAGAPSGIFGYTARVPLKDIPPGSYILSVRARSTLNDGQAGRDLPFQVLARGARTSTGGAPPPSR